MFSLIPSREFMIFKLIKYEHDLAWHGGFIVQICCYEP